MKITLKISLFLVLTFLSLLSLAQKQRFVEIIISDTLTLQAKQFTYQINIGEQMSFMGLTIPIPQTEKDSASLPALSDIEKNLEKNHFSYTINNENDYSISKSSQNPPTLLLTLTSKTELDRLFNLLKSMQGISGKIIHVEYESPVLFYNEIFNRLFSKAQAEASALAHVTGNETGKLLNITEIKEQQPEPYMDSYMELLKPLLKSFSAVDVFGQNNNLTKKYERKMQFKFELK